MTDPSKMTDCEHMNFRGDVQVMRLTDDDQVTGYSAEIKIKCMDCDMPFHFVGVAGGLSSRKPMVGFGGEELRAPIKPGLNLSPALMKGQA